MQGDLGRLRTLVTVGTGQGVQVQAEVPSTQFIYIKIGLGFYLQCTLPEALSIAAEREDQIGAKVDMQNDIISQIRARITLMKESIEAVQTM